MEITPTGDDIFKAVRGFLLAVLPPGTPVKQGEINRTPEPQNSDYAIMWLLMMPRLATNLDEYADIVFTGSIDADTLTVTAIEPGYTGTLHVGSPVFGDGVSDGTVITAIPGDISGGIGVGSIGDTLAIGGPVVFKVYPSQSVTSTQMAAGIQSVTQTADVTVQVDVHGPLSVQNAALIATLFRDQYAADLFEENGYPLSPLYADDPRQTPFINGEKQVEKRLSVDLHAQADFRVDVPQRFTDELSLTLADAANYPFEQGA